eukprot:gene11200-3256_t
MEHYSQLEQTMKQLQVHVASKDEEYCILETQLLTEREKMVSLHQSYQARMVSIETSLQDTQESLVQVARLIGMDVSAVLYCNSFIDQNEKDTQSPMCCLKQNFDSLSRFCEKLCFTIHEFVEKKAEEINHFKTQMEISNCTVQKLEQAKAKTVSDLTSKTEEISGLCQDLKQEKDKFCSLQQQFQELQQANSVSNHHTQTLSEDLLNQQKEISEWKALVDQLRAQFERDKSALHAKVESLNAELQRYITSTKQLAGDKGRLQSKVVELSSLERELNTQLQVQSKRLEELTQENEDVYSKLNVALTDINSLVSEKSVIQSELNQMRDGIISAHPYTRKRIEVLEQRLSKSEKIIRGLKQKLAEQQTFT